MIGLLLLLLSACLALLAVHPFITYPLSLKLLARSAPAVTRPAAPKHAALTRPKVALCVCAYNEEKVIRQKAENMLAMREAVPGLQLLIYVDCASDRTAAILSEFSDQIDVIISPTRHGKTHGMNLLVSKTDAELLVFSDANVTFATDAIPHLLRPFDDPAVGCVCGHLIYVTKLASATAATGSLYWRLEETIKELESRTGSVMGADGSIFAIRRELHRPPPVDIIDDMFISLSILCDGYRIMRAADAVAYEETTSHQADEFARKVRISCQAYNVHRLLSPRLQQLPALNRYKYVSHKLLRWFSIYSLGAAILLFYAALFAFHAWWIMLANTVTLIAIAIGGLALPSSLLGKVADVFSALLATGLGIVRSVRGDRFQVWTPPASARLITRD
ncbi:MAG: glycosyltransferase [Janthinobacterium lividum]